MAKVSFTKLGLKTNTAVNTFTFNDVEVEVLQYLPVGDKHDLVLMTLQSAEREGLYDEILLDMYFHLYVIYMYTNVNFTDKQRENELKLYDTLVSSGFMDAAIEAMDEAEYLNLLDYLKVIKMTKERYNSTIIGALSKMNLELPQVTDAALSAIQEFNIDDYPNLMGLAKAVGLDGNWVE